jgi:hypothetical protein
MLSVEVEITDEVVVIWLEAVVIALFVTEDVGPEVPGP